MFRVFLGLGSNIGDRLLFLSKAIGAIGAHAEIGKCSSIYETEPVGVKDQRSFYNLVIEIRTDLKPGELIVLLTEIEKLIGRKDNTHLLPREIDIDILLYDGYIYNNDRISVPHVNMTHRRFVLEPLNEIAPELQHPFLRKTIGNLLRECDDYSTVVKTNQTVTSGYADKK